MIGIYGGAFDPIHNGHIGVMKAVLSQVDTLFVVPAFKHPFGKNMADFDLRYSWANRVIFDSFFEIGKNMNVFVSDVEARLYESLKRTIYTIDTLEFIEKHYNLPKKEIGFIIGQDNLENMPKFKDYDKIKEYSLIVIDEQLGFKHSSELKRNLSKNSLQNQVPDIIINDIISHYNGVL